MVEWLGPSQVWVLVVLDHFISISTGLSKAPNHSDTYNVQWTNIEEEQYECSSETTNQNQFSINEEPAW
jgi:hypothetical protein